MHHEEANMPSLEEFLEDLEKDALAALAKYNFVVDGNSLDYVPNKVEPVRDEFKQVDVTIDFGGNPYTIRAMKDNDSPRDSLSIWYLPWKRFGESGNTGLMAGLSQAVLNGKGPGIFLTSNLDGC